MATRIEKIVSDERIEEIVELAEIVAETHCPDVKIEPETIARRKEITFCYGRYGNSFDGILEHSNGRFHIYCNLDRVESRGSGRARFTSPTSSGISSLTNTAMPLLEAYARIDLHATSSPAILSRSRRITLRQLY